MIAIQVYVTEHCLGCDQARQMVRDLMSTYRELDARLVNLDEIQSPPESLIAVPTWYVNGRIWRLGNPDWDDLQTLVETRAAGD